MFESPYSDHIKQNGFCLVILNKIKTAEMAR